MMKLIFVFLMLIGLAMSEGKDVEPEMKNLEEPIMYANWVPPEDHRKLMEKNEDGKLMKDNIAKIELDEGGDKKRETCKDIWERLGCAFVRGDNNPADHVMADVPIFYASSSDINEQKDLCCTFKSRGRTEAEDTVTVDVKEYPDIKLMSYKTALFNAGPGPMGYTVGEGENLPLDEHVEADVAKPLIQFFNVVYKLFPIPPESLTAEECTESVKPLPTADGKSCNVQFDCGKDEIGEAKKTANKFGNLFLKFVDMYVNSENKERMINAANWIQTDLLLEVIAQYYGCEIKNLIHLRDTDISIGVQYAPTN